MKLRVRPAVDESISQGARSSEMFPLVLDLVLLQLSNWQNVWLAFRGQVMWEESIFECWHHMERGRGMPHGAQRDRGHRWRETPVVHLTGTPVPLLTRAQKAGRPHHWICIFNFAICITNPCKVNPGSNGLLLQERSEHIGTREKGGNPVKILNKGWKREEVCRGFEQGFLSLSFFFFFLKKNYLFVWLCWVLVEAQRI